jgi:acyl carrier protein
MNNSEILNDLTKIFIEIFEDPQLKLTENTSPSDIPDWDSMNHVILISAIEKHFNIRFDLDDMLGFNTIADILKGINKKLGK